MKTIFDKIDPQYIDCATGGCEHAMHNVNALIWILPILALLFSIYKYTHGYKNEK